MGAFQAIVDAVRETRRAVETAAGLGPVFVPIFQTRTATMGSPIESARFKQVWKRKSPGRQEPFLKRYFLPVSGVCLIDSSCDIHQMIKRGLRK